MVPPPAVPAPVTRWDGWDVRKASDRPGIEEVFDGWATAGGGAEVCAGYELLAVAARGFRPPRFLSTADLPGDGILSAGVGNVHDLVTGTGTGGPYAGVPGDGAPPDGLRLVWSLLYRRIVGIGSSDEPAHAIYLLGVDPPPEATADQLVVFDDFYTNVHLPEVADRRRALRAVRYELVRAVRPPYQGPPRYLAVYEVDEQGAANRRHTGPPYSTGPPVWQQHTTPWRLWYRRLAPGMASDASGGGVR